MSGSVSITPDWLDVSRETLARLRVFCGLVEKWSPAINLVSRADLANLWDRHILDTAQLFYKSPTNATSWCDIGSGGGFPGIVVAIVAAEVNPKMLVTLVESDRRKSVFLSEAVRILGVEANVVTKRIEALSPQGSDVLSARALAPLSVLCGYASRHLGTAGVAIFQKGKGAEQEIETAQQSYKFRLERTASLTDSAAWVLCLKEVRRV